MIDRRPTDPIVLALAAAIAEIAARRALSESLFERVDVLGLRSMRLEPTPAAIARGLAEAFSSASAGYGRGERAQGSANQQIRGCRVTMPVQERRIRLVG